MSRSILLTLFTVSALAFQGSPAATAADQAGTAAVAGGAVEVVVQEDAFLLHQPGETVEIVDDAAAVNGKAARMPGSHFQWAVQLRDLGRLGLKGSWRCFVRLRYEAEPEATGEAFWAGCGKLSGGFTTNQNRIEPDGGQYRDYDLGFPDATGDGYLWVAPPRPVNPQLKAVFVDSFIFREIRYRQPAPGWTDALKPKGAPGDEVALAVEGRTEYRILLSGQPTTMEQRAAEELALWLHEMSGAAFPVTREDAAGAPGPVVSIGNTARWTASGLPRTDLSLDGYGIGVKDSSLFLTGGSRRGILNAVYALLEEDLGCRWYLPGRDGAVVPRLATLRFRPVPRAFVPPFELLRGVHYSDVDDTGWNLQNRTFHWWDMPAGWGGYAHWVPSICHTYNSYLNPGEFFGKHPEYFMMMDDGKRIAQQLCPSHPEVVSIIALRSRELLAKNPDASFLDISPNDGGGACHCPTCKALIAAEGTEMAPLLQLVNTIADGIRAEYPQVAVTTLAYLNTVVPPKTFGPRLNVIPWLCTDAHAWAFNDLFIWETDTSSTAMQAWHDRWQSSFLVWDYPSFFTGMAVSFNLPTIAPNLRWYIERGARGILFQCADAGNQGVDHSYLRSWVYAKLGWDPTLDTRQLIRDFNWGFYGAAAAPEMQAYDDMLWSLWESWHREKVTNTPWDTAVARQEKRAGQLWASAKDDPGFWEGAGRHLDAAERAAAGDPLIRQRVRTARLPWLCWRLEQGPRDDVAAYAALIDEFEADARKAGFDNFLTYDYSGKNSLPAKVAYWRKLAAPPADIPLVELDNAWRFAPDPGDKGVAEGWFGPDYADLAWGRVRSDTGNGWESQGFAGVHLGWYRQTFNLTEDVLKHPVLWLLFGGVDEQATVFINGKLAFEHTEKSTGLTVAQLWDRPFVFDAKPFLRAGANTLAVRVQDTVNMAGIWRPVRLILQDARPDPQTVLDDLQVLRDREKLRPR